jgi:hypothetical protein
MPRTPIACPYSYHSCSRATPRPGAAGLHRRPIGRTALALCMAAGLLAPNGAAAEDPAPSTTPASVRPEREVRHGIGVRFGARGTSVRDDLLVPLGFSGGGPDFGLVYHGLLGPGALAARLEVGASFVANRFGHLGFTIDHALAVGYFMPVATVRAWRLQIGTILGEDTDSLALESWDDAHRYWLGLAWLGAGGRVAGPLGARWRLEAETEFAFLGFAGRPPEVRRSKQEPTASFSYYVFHPLADPRFVGFWDVQHWRFNVAARRTTSPGRVGHGWSFGCQGRLTRADFPRTIIVLEASLYTSWTWGL